MVVNRGFAACNIAWHSHGKSIHKEAIDGECANGGPRVTVLSTREVYHATCHNLLTMEQFYVWHKTCPKNGEKKVKAAEGGHALWLRKDWKELKSTAGEDRILKGTEWLVTISV